MKTLELTGSPSSNSPRFVSEDRNFLMGGSSCGNSCNVIEQCYNLFTSPGGDIEIVCTRQ